MIDLTKRPRRCGGRGYYIVAPNVPGDWDVDVVRIDCKGCDDCLTATCDLCETKTKAGESICWDCVESVSKNE